MKAGKITAKLRDAVKVCFMVEGEEVKRYKNIEMPDALKELEIRDFAFNVLTDGKIEFWLHFDEGILPTEWPELRERKVRTPKAEQDAPDITEAASEHEIVEEAAAISAEIEEASEVTEAAMESEEPAEAPEVAATPARVKQPGKRGRKPGSHFIKQHTDESSTTEWK